MCCGPGHIDILPYRRELGVRLSTTPAREVGGYRLCVGSLHETSLFGITRTAHFGIEYRDCSALDSRNHEATGNAQKPPHVSFLSHSRMECAALPVPIRDPTATICLCNSQMTTALHLYGQTSLCSGKLNTRHAQDRFRTFSWRRIRSATIRSHSVYTTRKQF